MVTRSQIVAYCAAQSVPSYITTIVLAAYDYVGLGSSLYPRFPAAYSGIGSVEFGRITSIGPFIDSLIDAWNIGLDMTHALACTSGVPYWVIPERIEGAWYIAPVAWPMSLVGQWWDGVTLSLMPDELPKFRTGYSPTVHVAVAACVNGSYQIVDFVGGTSSRKQFQSYDMVGSVLGAGSKTYLAGGSVEADTATDYDVDGLLETTLAAQYEAGAFAEGKAAKSYSIMARSEANPILTYDMDGITELGKAVTYDAGAYAEKLLRTTYVAGGYTQDIATSSYAMSGLILADEFPPFEIPQAFIIRKPSTSECSGYPFDSRNM